MKWQDRVDMSWVVCLIGLGTCYGIFIGSRVSLRYTRRHRIVQE